VAVVTGAASGIGFGLTQRLAAGGASVVLADIEESALKSATRTVGAHGAEVLGVRTDVSVPADMDALAEAAIERFGTVHIVCPNAGVSAGAGLRTWEVPSDDWEWIYAVNVFGVVNMVRSFVPILIGQGEGHVVVTASNSSVLTLLGVPAYASSKHAVISIAESLQQDLRDVGSPVQVSVLLPGPVKSQIANAERNRQSQFGQGHNRPTEVIALAAEKLCAAGDEPTDVGDLVVAALAENRFYIFSRPHDVAKAQHRFAGIVNGSLATPSNPV
jgi:NAD(P)-dependent dehydrogenase (short-subunit alcohol dehydrogenase family)